MKYISQIYKQKPLLEVFLRKHGKLAQSNRFAKLHNFSSICYKENMPSILLFICFALIFLLIKGYFNQSWRESLIQTALVWGTLVVAITEITSIFKLIEFWSFTIIWGSLSLILLIFLIISGKTKRILKELRSFRLYLQTGDTAMLVVFLAIILYLGIISILAPPNTWDSMTYHMSRIIHWVQNKTIAFYPTHILRQLHQSPWSEFAILQFQVLSGGDRFANLIQWFCMIGSLIGVSLIAQELRANTRTQFFSAAICLSIPMGILQSTSTQNDYVVSFWLVCFAFFSLRYLKDQKTSYAAWIGISLSLSILTKATAFIYAFPFVIWLGIYILQKLNKRAIEHIALLIVLTVSLNLGYFFRNINLYGSPIGPGEEYPGYYYVNKDFTPAAFTSNFIRNIGLHLGTPDEKVNAFLTKGVDWFHKEMGISPTEEQTTWPGMKFKVHKLSFTEDSGGNLIHLILIFIVIWFFVFQKRKEKNEQLYISALLVGFLLFCLILRWQPWHSRLHLPFFVLFSPCLGICFSRIRTKWISSPLILLVILASIPWIILNPAKPLLSDNNVFRATRANQYFRLRPDAEAPYTQAATILANHSCFNLGAILSTDAWEYPLWPLLKEKTTGDVIITQVNVNNISSSTNLGENALSHTPCAIFTVNAAPQKTIVFKNSEYFLDWSSTPYNLYFPESTP